VWIFNLDVNGVVLIIIVCQVVLFTRALRLVVAARAALATTNNLHTRSTIQSLVRLGGPRVPAELFALVSISLATISAPHIGNAADVGFVSAAQSLMSATLGIVQPISSLLLPRVANLLADGNIEYARERLVSVLSFTYFVGGNIALQIVVWADVIVRVLLGPSYLEAVALMLVMIDQ
jgi:O-antigen/teichoic acid export membrane protein